MEFLSKEVLAALHHAKERATRRASRLRIEAGSESWRVLRRWSGGFALDARQVVHLRGDVDLYDGGRHVAQLLIVASDVVDGELICIAKRETVVTGMAPLDYVQENRVAGYLPPA